MLTHYIMVGVDRKKLMACHMLLGNERVTTQLHFDAYITLDLTIRCQVDWLLECLQRDTSSSRVSSMDTSSTGQVVTERLLVQHAMRQQCAA